MTDAIDLVNNPELGIPALTTETATVQKRATDELSHFRIGHDDIKNLIFNIYGFGGVRGSTVRTNIRPSVTDAVFEDSIDKTNTFTVTVHDPDWELLNTGALDETIDLNPGRIKNLWYRLDSFTVNDDEITLVFSTRNAVYLSYHHKAYKASRKRVTRAQFILSMLRKVKVTKIPFHCPQLNVRQPVETQTEAQVQAQHHRAPGFTSSDKITVGGTAANETQRDAISETIRAGVASQAPGLVIVSAIMCIEVESNANTNVGVYDPIHHPYKGAFQQNPRYGWPSTGNVYKDALGFYKAAIPRYRKNPNVDLGLFVQAVQGAYGGVNWNYPFKINSHRQEAQHAFQAWNSGIPVNDPGSGQIEVVGNYEFGIGLKAGSDSAPYRESYLAAAYRLADDVGWSFFWVKDTAYYMSEHDMFRSKARARLRRGVHGVESVNFTLDHYPQFDEKYPRGPSQKFNQMTLSVRMDRWVCPLGTVVDFDEGGPAQGRWLVTNIRRSMFNDLGEIVLGKPLKEKKEPLVTTTKNVATGSSGNNSTGNVPSTGEWAYPLEVRGRLIGFPNDPGSTHDPHAGNGPGGYLWQDDNAVDIACPVGTHEYAVDDGVFFNVGGFYHDGSGRYEGLKFSIRTKDNEVFYQHSSWRAAWVQNGARVNKGDYIARTGKGNGVAHLHFACKNGNPQVLLGQANEVVTSGGVWPGLYVVTSPFGEPRSYEIHHGCDVGVPYNTKCIAPFNGTVTFAENSGFDPGGAGGGMLHLRLDNNQAGLSAGDKIGWGHCHNVQVSVGTKVKKGRVLAYSNGSPAHVHFVLIRPGHGGNGIDGNSDPFPFLQRIGSAYEH